MLLLLWRLGGGLVGLLFLAAEAKQPEAAGRERIDVVRGVRIGFRLGCPGGIGRVSGTLVRNRFGDNLVLPGNRSSHRLIRRGLFNHCLDGIVVCFRRDRLFRRRLGLVRLGRRFAGLFKDVSFFLHSSGFAPWCTGGRRSGGFRAGCGHLLHKFFFFHGIRGGAAGFSSIRSGFLGLGFCFHFRLGLVTAVL